MRGGKREGAGRPKGKSSLTTAREALIEHSDDIINALLKKVQDGDIQAIKLAVERLVPVVKEDSASDSEDIDPDFRYI